MSDETTETPKLDLQGLFQPVKELFAALVVRERYCIQDIYGNSYEFAPTLSARKQMHAALVMDDVWQRAQGRLTKLREEAKSQLAESDDKEESSYRLAWWFVRQAASDESVAHELDNVWAALHCSADGDGLHDLAVNAARQRRKDKGLDVAGYRPTVLDLFSLEAIIEGMFPFFVRSGTGLLSVVNKLSSKADQV